MRPQEGGLISADFFGRSPRDSSSHQRKPTPGSAFGNSRNSPSSGSVNLTDREEGRLDALEEALRFAVAVLPVLVHPSVPSVLPEAEVHLAQSTRSQLSLCTVNTTERNFANNPYPSGISGELDFSSSLLAARGERDAGEPAVCLRNENFILNSALHKACEKKCLLTAHQLMLFTVLFRWRLGSRIETSWLK